MKYDLMLIGPATRDVNIDYTGKEVHEIGGAVFFCAAAAKAAGANLFASVKIHPNDTDIIDAFKLDSDHVAILPSETTTLMQNTYFTADRERRKAECKISGICGRLLCCLSYEQENYDIFHSSCPRLGKRYQTNKGPMKVLRANMFRNSVALLTDTNEELELTLDEWQALDPRRPDAPPRPEGKPDAKPENKPSSPRPHDELMVVMADPDTIDEAFGDESDELVDDLGGLNDGEMETLEEGLRPKRKRKRKR